MALQQKIVAKTDIFVPSVPGILLDPGERKSARWENFLTWKSSIKWAQLNEAQFMSQWGACLNAIHVAEADGLVERSDLYPFFNKYLKIRGYTQEQREALRAASDSDVTFSIVSKAYLLITGNVDNKYCLATDKWLTEQLKRVLAKAPAPVLEEASNKRTIADRKRDKCSDLIGELQGLEDEREEVDMLAFLTERSVAKEYLHVIEARYRPRLQELQEVLVATPATNIQLLEAYRCYKRGEIKQMIAWYESLLDACMEYRDVKVQARKPRVKKPRTVDKVVSKLQYMQQSDELKITSVDPKKLVGCNQVWLYNTHYRRLIVYYASEQEKQLTVKGTTILGWDPKTSIQKTLRKPEEQLAEFMQVSGRVALRQYMASVKTAANTPRGRMSEDVLILKVL